MSLTAITTLIKRLVARFATARDLAAGTNRQIQIALDSGVPQVRRAARHLASIRSELITALESSRDLFEKPRTRTIEGVKIGFRRGKAAYRWDSDDTLIARIKKHLPPEVAHVLIRKVEKPVATAIAGLTPTELKAIGVTCTEPSDDPFVTVDRESLQAIETLVGPIDDLLS